MGPIPTRGTFLELRGLAQLAARTVWDREASSSSLLPPTMVAVAQLAEHPPVERRVGGSSPLSHPQVPVAQLERASRF